MCSLQEGFIGLWLNLLKDIFCPFLGRITGM